MVANMLTGNKRIWCGANSAELCLWLATSTLYVFKQSMHAFTRAYDEESEKTNISEFNESFLELTSWNNNNKIK